MRGAVVAVIRLVVVVKGRVACAGGGRVLVAFVVAAAPTEPAAAATGLTESIDEPRASPWRVSGSQETHCTKRP